MRGADYVVLQAQIIEQKLDRIIVVRLDASHLGRSENDDLRFFLREERVDRSFQFGEIRVCAPTITRQAKRAEPAAFDRRRSIALNRRGPVSTTNILVRSFSILRRFGSIGVYCFLF